MHETRLHPALSRGPSGPVPRPQGRGIFILDERATARLVTATSDRVPTSARSGSGGTSAASAQAGRLSAVGYSGAGYSGAGCSCAGYPSTK